MFYTFWLYFILYSWMLFVKEVSQVCRELFTRQQTEDDSFIGWLYNQCWF